ncbi:hypothetical protein ACFE04_015708 [Oxalis oulophora]
MKLLSKITPKSLSPKRLFGSKKDRSTVSRSSDPSSFSSSSSSEASLHKPTSSDAYYFELAHAFKLIDKDNDGFISRTELEKLLTQLTPESPSQEDVSLMLSEVSCEYSSDGLLISVESLISRAMACNEPACDNEMRKVFDIFDADKDGKISAEELLSFFTALGDEECTLEDCLRMIAGVDDNGDGFVCFEDFTRMMELQRY